MNIIKENQSFLGAHECSSVCNCSHHQTNSVRLISIEGNIGAGKTTILENLEHRYSNDSSILFLREPVDIWATIQDKSGVTMLERFYENTQKYAFPFQIMAYATRLSALRKLIKNNPLCKVIICERSLEADQKIFAKMLFDDGMIDDISYQVYNHFFREYYEDYMTAGIVYVDSNPETCFRRIVKRSREGENKIGLDYLTNCGRYHDEWLNPKKTQESLSAYPILKIDTNLEATFDENNQSDVGIQWLDQIAKFIERLK